MDFDNARQRLCGCYVTVPTLFHDDDELSLNLEGIGRHVSFLLAGGLESGNAVFLAGGAAGDFSTMTFEERVAVAGTVVEAVAGRAPVAMGAQTTSTSELRRLARAARDLGADYIQVSCPYYFHHSEDDFYEYVAAAAEASHVGIIVYTRLASTPSGPAPGSLWPWSGGWPKYPTWWASSGPRPTPAG